MEYATLPQRLAAVRERIDAACLRSGREAADVAVVAVTKTHPPAAVTAALAAGLVDVGENRVQELEEKVGELGREAVRWHLIGQLQRNKARRALGLFDLLHSLESLRLAQRLSADAAEAGITVRALVQVNASGEESKSGLAPEELADALGQMCELPALRIEGLMTMAPLTDDERVVRETFRSTRVLQEDAARQIAAFQPRHLSMGMSNDFEVAVEEGSTLVRLGTVLFGER